MVITQEKELALWFEEVIQKTTEYKMAANWVMGPIKALLNERAIEISQMTLSPDQLVGILNLIASGKVSSSTAAEKILPVLFDQPQSDASEIAQQMNLVQDAGDDEIEKIAQDILAAWPDKVAAYQAGNKGLMGLFMGELMPKDITFQSLGPYIDCKNILGKIGTDNIVDFDNIVSGVEVGQKWEVNLCNSSGGLPDILFVVTVVSHCGQSVIGF